MKKDYTDNGSDCCDLCLTHGADLILEADGMSYYRCSKCGLIFVPPGQHLPEDEEKRRYDLHENDPADPEYRSFLNTLLEPLIEKLTHGSSGLDYGCGPGPAVSTMMRELGFKMRDYDPHFLDRSEALDDQYDFITCTEVVEHFRSPAQEWERLVNLVKKGGWIGIMTDFVDEETDFSRWHYRRDQTHIAFYSKQTFLWIADQFNLEVSFPCNRVALFEKQ